MNLIGLRFDSALELEAAFSPSYERCPISSRGGTLNLYRDRVQENLDPYGCDISSQRLDELDWACIDYARTLSRYPAFGLDLGSGLGRLCTELAEDRISMTIVDLLDLSDCIRQRLSNTSWKYLRFVHKDARQLQRQDLPNRLDFIYSQRFIHYIRFDEAVSLLRMLRELLFLEGKIFISASGLNSPLGDNYEHKSKPVRDRFCYLSDKRRQEHKINARVCLYTKEDLDDLGVAAGFVAEKITQSDFGNIKGIFKNEKK